MAKVIGICGLKNSGKTTLINRLVRRLSEQGIKVAVIKHDGHDFDCDIPGTDTYSFTKSGAYGVACFSANRVFVHKTGTGENEDLLLQLFPEADITLVEGLKDRAWPKIEVVRSAISRQPVSNPEGRFLIATDLSLDAFEEAAASLDDIESIVARILE